LQSGELDARSNRTEQQYDGLGRPARTIYADSAQAWTAMDQRGQAVFRRQRGGSRAAVFYDAAGRDFHVREFAETDKDYMYKGRNSRASYDLAGRPVWRDVSTQTTLTTTFDDSLRRDVRNYGYDPAGRMTSEQWRPEGVGGISFTTGYGYDAANNRTSIAWPGAWTATYAYDAANRIQTVSFPGASGTQTVTLNHDSLSRRTGIDRPGAAADSSYAYEPDSDLASLSHAFVAGSGPGAVSFSYGHDAAGKTTTIGISQPAFEWLPSLSYATTYGAANVLNQISSAGGVSIPWTTDGNMVTDGVTTYIWGYGNRMIAANRSGMSATYDYDSDDRRTKKTVNGVVTRMMWSGADELAEYDVNGDLIRRFVPDGTGAMDARLATVTAANAVYWHHVDHQGTVIATSDSAGQTVGTASYSPYGEFAAGTTTPPQHSPFGYTGRQYDVETGLYYYRARYYSPKLGQFLSMDPVGTKDDPNLYLYVGLDPVNATDPTGRSCEMIGSGRTRRLSCFLDDPGNLSDDEVLRANRNYTTAVRKLIQNAGRTAFVNGQGRRVSATEVAAVLIGMHVKGDRWGTNSRGGENRAAAVGANSDLVDPGGRVSGRSITIFGVSIRRDQRNGTSNIDYDLQNQFVHEGIHHTRGEPRDGQNSTHDAPYDMAADELLRPKNLWERHFGE
jgi:RHS repeat-associated protein